MLLHKCSSSVKADIAPGKTNTFNAGFSKNNLTSNNVVFFMDFVVYVQND